MRNNFFFILTISLSLAWGTTINVPADQTTIQAGIDAATTGDTVLVQPGTYTETIDYNGKNIVVGSLFLTTSDTSYISSTIIDANRAGRVVTLTNGETSAAALIGMTLTDGLATGPNASDRRGGGILMWGTSARLDHLRIIGNEGAEYGGGISIVVSNGETDFTNLLIDGNTALWGGGINIQATRRLLNLNNVTISNNTGTTIGGGMHIGSSDSLNAENVIIQGNSSNQVGGVYLYWSTIDATSYIFSNCIIVDNSSSSYPGGLKVSQLHNSMNIYLNNVTLWGNENDGFEFYDGNDQGGGVSIKNSIFNMDATNILNLTASTSWNLPTLDINYSLISGTTSGTGNISGNPLFADAAAGDYHLGDYSPAIGTGTTTGAPTTDLDGNLRPNPAGSNPDIGAYENTRSTPLPYDYVHVATTGTDAGSFGLESAPFATIQAAIDFSASGDTVLVHPGTYVENINFNGNNIVVGSQFLTTPDTSYISSTIIDGNQAGSVVTFDSGEDSTTVLSGFTVRNGSATNGGGIYCYSSSSPSLNNLTISGNTASSYGGGISCGTSSSPNLNNLTISGNTALNAGGIYCEYTSLSLVNVTISGNTVDLYGGGIFCEYSSLSLTNTIISGNAANYGGGACFGTSSSPSLVNVTITGNIANYGGGIYNSGTPSLLNTLVASNSSPEIYISSGSVAATYSLIQGGWAGTGNIDSDAYFVDAANGDYHLSDYSPAIGTGTATGAPTTDLDGNIRPNPAGSNPDMGAYENARSTPTEIPPDPPQNLTATKGNQQVTLRWDRNAETDLAKYRIYRNTSSPATTLIDSVVASSPPDTFFTDTGLTNEQIYYYRITAVDSSENAGGFSNEVSATPNPIIITVKTDGSGDYTVIQTAIDASTNEDTVLVYAGTYTENINFNGKNIVVGSQFLTTGNTSHISSTIIDGNDAGSVVTFDYRNNSTTVLSGFTIRNGSATSGGGIYCGSSSTPTLKNLTISGNTASEHGGGIYCISSNPSLTNLTITGNTASIRGGGIYCYQTSNPVLTNVVISGNTATYGSGIYDWSSSPSLVNVTIGGNSASSNGGGIYNTGTSSNPTLLNTVLWGNSPGEIDINSGSVVSTYSNIQGGYTGTGNINVDPFFVDTANGDYHLSNYSQVIGAGTSTGAPTTDLDGNARPNPGGSNPDMGAYENALSTAAAPPAPTSLSADGGNGVVNLSWTGNVYATGYSVYRSTTSGSGFTAIATGIDTTVYTNSGLTNHTTYYYKVSATGTGGESVLTDQVSATPIPLLYTVKKDGSGDYTVIQNAIDFSLGDTILVYPGTYTENINFNGKNIVVGSLFLTTGDTSYISSTIIDGNDAGRVVIFGSGEDSTAVLSGFTIRNGSASNGGGIYFASSSSPSLKNLTISGNSASSYGGGIYCINSNPSLSNLMIDGNTAHYGGGIWITSSSPSLLSLTIRGNTATHGGGISFYTGSSPSLVNVEISGNTGSTMGGGVYSISQNSSPSFVNVTISGNTSSSGGGIYCGESSTPSLLNTLVASNSSPEIYISSGSVTATYSNIQGGWTGTGNIDASPWFVDPENGDYRLMDYSLAIGAGTITGAPTTDMDGNIRPNPAGSNPDMGAYENARSTPLPYDYVHVKTTGNDAGSIGLESAPFATIQAAIDFSLGDTILVYPGTYVENINFNGKNIVVGSLYLTTNDTSYISSTIIDGNQAGTVVTFDSGEDSTAVLSGFTVRNGSATNGGGIYCYNYSSPSLTNLTISGNTASGNGGGIYWYNYSSQSINNVILSGNTGSYGGGIFSRNSNLSLTNAIINGNTGSYGGGIYTQGPYNVSLVNVTISGNIGSYGGGIGCSGPSSFVNVTISGNTASSYGGGILALHSSAILSLLNTIVSGNVLVNSPDEINILSGSVVATYSLIQGGWTGTGNIDANPWFVDPDNGDYRLMDYSSCIGAGTATGAPTTDLDGNTRPNPAGSNPDMGAYENARSAPLPYDYVHVKTTGTDAGSIGLESAPFATIQAAIDFSQGDTVLVHPGTYTETINYNGNSIVVGSLYMTTGDTSYISSTIIDADGAGRVVTFENGETGAAALIGLTLTDGYAVGANATDRQGGGIRMYRTAPFLSNLRIIDNEAADNGGGIWIDNYGGGRLRFENLVVSGNTAQNYGGIYVYQSPQLITFDNLIVTNNTASSSYGGMYLSYIDSLMINDFIIQENTGGTSSGIDFRYSKSDLSSISLSNGIIVDNSNRGLYVYQSSYQIHLYIDNVTIWGNGVNDFEFSDGSDKGGSIDITNSIIDVNAGDIITTGSTDWVPTTLDINYSLISGTSSGTGNISGNPLFVDAGNGDYHLSDYSPGIGTGTATGAPTTDLDGNTRPNPGGSNPDIGAYENTRSAPLPYDYVHVNAATGDDANSFGVESAPFASIQAAIDFSASGDTVLVHPGTYVENIDFNGNNIVVGSQFLTTSDTSYISSTIIDGNQAGTVVTFDSGEDSTAVLSGFTIRNGLAEAGGGISCTSISSPSLENLTISGNTASAGGGGIYIFATSPSFINVRISGNTASSWGGGIYCRGNTNPSFVNGTINGNTSGSGGGIYTAYSCSLSLVNVTISGNTASFVGGGIFCLDATTSLLNTIVSGNSQEIYLQSGSSINATYSLIQGGWTGTGNIDSDPYFVDATNGDFHLSDYSPAIGAGTAPGAPQTDLDGNIRPNPAGTNPDMGAYENARGTPTEIPPGTPQNLTAIYGNQKIVLRWDRITDADLAKYRIYRSTSSLATTLIDSVVSSSPPDTFYTDTGLTNGQIYYYRISAVDSAGTVSDGYSNEVSATPNPIMITVKKDGSGDYTVIQTAIDASTDEDTVLVYAGTYTENINFSGKNIVVGSLFLTTSNTSYISSTIIDGNQDTSVVIFDYINNSTTVLSGFTIRNGSATKGGGIFCGGSSTPTLKNLTISGNSASEHGGGIYCVNAHPGLVNVTISGNTASIRGGGIYCYNTSNPVLTNVVISGNTALYGSGIYNWLSSPSLVNVTITGNTALQFEGGGIFTTGASSNPTLLNTVMWGNTPDEILTYTGSVVATYSNIQGGYTGTGNIDADPLFVDTANGDYRLTDYSPAIGAGTTTGAPTTDLDGNPRPNPSGSNPDMGAYENSLSAASAPPTPTSVSAVIGNGVVNLSWTGNIYATGYSVYRSEISGSGFTSIATSIDTTVYTNSGLTNNTTYYYQVSATGAGGESTLTSEINATPTPQLYTVKTDGSGDYTVIQTAIDASTDADTVLVHSGTYVENINFNGKNIVVGSLFLTTQDTSYISSTIIDGNQNGSVVTFESGEDSTTFLFGFTIRNGSGKSENSSERGGGIYCFSSSPNLEYLKIINNTASFYGNGGGVYLNNSSGKLTNSIIDGNSCSEYGAGLYIISSDQAIINNTIISNNFGSEGDVGGGGLYISGSPTLANITVVKNNTARDGSGIFAQNSSTIIKNSIIWDNSENPIFGLTAVEYSCIENGFSGTNNIDVDPIFVDTANGNYRLSDYSPAIGAGTTTGAPTTDLDGNPRPNPSGSNPDMGAYENSLPSQRPKAGGIIDGLVQDLDWTNSISTLSANWSLFDDNGVVNYEIAIGSSAGSIDIFGWAPVGSLPYYTASGLSLSEGSTYYVSVRATDTDNQVSDTTTTDGITIDVTVPVITSIFEGSVTADRDYQNSDSTLTLAGTGTDEASGIAGFEFALGSSSGAVDIVGWAASGLATSDTLTGLSLNENTTYFVSARATDVAGNVSTVSTGNGITIDFTPPAVGTVNDGQGADISYTGSNDSLSANWSGFSDPLSEIEGYELAIGTTFGGTDIVDWTWVGAVSSAMETGLSLSHDNTYYTSIRARDVAGNTSAVVTSDGIIVDTAEPNSEVSIIADFYNTAGWDADTIIVGTASDATSGMALVEISIHRTTDNTYWNGSTWSGGEQWLTAHETENWSYDLGSTMLDNGYTYEIRSRATDAVGNVETSFGSDSFTYDDSEPNCVFSLPDDYYNSNSWDSSAPIQGTAGDTYSSISHVEVQIKRSADQYFWDGSKWFATSDWVVAQGTANWQYTLSSDSLSNADSYTIDIRATDGAGNVETTYTADGFTFDSSPPQSSVLIEQEFYNSNNWSDATSINGTAVDTISGLTTIEISIQRSSDGVWWGGTSWGVMLVWLAPTGLAAWTYSFNSASLTNGGSYNVYSRGTDITGNVQTQLGEDIFTYDLTGPVVGQVNDGLPGEESDWTNSTNTLSGYWTGFSDLVSGIASYKYGIGSTTGATDVVSMTDNGTDTLFTATGLPLQSGSTYYISVVAVDSADNTSSSATSDGITSDASAPVVSAIYEGAVGQDFDFQQNDSTLVLSWDGSDNGSREINFYKVSLGTSPADSDVVDWLDLSGVTTTTFSGLSMLEGVPYYGNVQIIDMAGNESDIVSGDGIAVDLTGPTAGQVSDGDSSDVDWVLINYLVSANWTGFVDSLSGIGEFEYSIGLNPGGTQTLPWASSALDTFFSSSASIVEGPTYYVNVRAIDAVGITGSVASSNGFGLDQSAPTGGMVQDGLADDVDWTNETAVLSANWSGFSDTYSGIDFYEYSVGTSSGGSNIVTWTDVDTSLAITHTGLSLSTGSTYYFNIRATDFLGNVSNVMNSDGITVDTIPPVMSYVYEGSTSNDLDYQGSDSTIILAWLGSDDVSGIERYEFAFGTTAGGTELIDWVSAGLGLDTLISTPTLIEETTYYGSVRSYDSAGNASQIESGDGITVDLSPPSVGSIIDGLTVDEDFTGSNNTLIASWSGFSDTLSGIQYYEYAVGTSSGETDVKSWGGVQLNLSVTDESLTLSNGTTYYISVRATDNVMNTSEIVTTNGILADHSPPLGSWVIDGDSVDIERQNYTYHYDGKWATFTDVGSGLQFYEYALYDTTDEQFIIGWNADAGMDTIINLTGLELTDEHVYQLHVRGVDSVDNVGTAIFSNGVYIDLSAPLAPQNLVGYFSTQRIKLDWDANTEDDLSYYTVYGGTSPDPATFILQSAVNQAEAYIDDFPDGETIYLILTASDSLGNEGPFSNQVQGISQAAMITRVSPADFSTLEAGNQEISIHFSQPLNSIGTAVVSSLAYSDVEISADYSESDTSITINLIDPLASLDTLELTITDILDWAGNGTDEKNATFYTYLLADYNKDYAIDVSDLSDFVNGWASEDFAYELGPVTGTLPHLIPALNNLYDLRDVMTFTRLWDWNHQQSSVQMLAYESIGSGLEIEQLGNKIIITVPQEISVGQVIIQYPPSSMDFKIVSEEISTNRIFLSKKEVDLGQLLVECAYLEKTNQKQIVFETEALTRNNSNITIGYNFLSQEKQIINQGIELFDVKAIPMEFALHHNYPNPFNPTTTIRYDLPEDNHVSMVIYDLLGREVTILVNKRMEAGYYSIRWNGRNGYGKPVGAGVYFVQFISGDHLKTNKMILLK